MSPGSDGQPTVVGPASVVQPHRWLYAALLGTNALTVIASTAAAPTLPELARVFARTPGIDVLVPLVLTLSPLAIALSGPAVGLVLDRWGRRKVLLFGTALYGVGGSAAALAQTLVQVLATRLLLGIAVACLLTGTTTAITDAYGPRERARVLSLQMATVGVFGTVFVALSGVLVEVDWRAPFLVYLMAVPLFPLVWVAVRETRQGHVPPDPAGQKVQPYTPAAQVGAIGLPARARVRSRLSQGSGRASAPSGERPFLSGRHREPLSPVGKLWLLVPVFYLSMASLQVVNFLTAIHLPFHLEASFGLGGAAAGIAIGATTFSFALGAASSGPFVRSFPPSRLGAMATGVIGAGYLAMGYGGPILVMTGALISGFGFGLLVPNLLVWLGVVAPEASRGRLFGGMTTALFLGQFISSFIWQPVVDRIDRGPAFAVAGWLVLCASVILVVIGLGRPRTKDESGRPGSGCVAR